MSSVAPNSTQKLMLQVLRLVLKPVVGFCLRHSIKLQDLLEVLKAEFLTSAEDVLTQRGERVTQSRLSVMTGVHRRDVGRLEKEPHAQGGAKNILIRVMGQWLSDRRFLTRDHKPKVLSFGNTESEFHKLVALVSTDLNAATVLYELERIGAVEKGTHGVELRRKSYIPKGDPQQSFRLAGEDLGHLLEAVEENVFGSTELPNHHLRTEYDKIREDSVPEIKAWLLREGHALHARARDFISTFDQDINPDLKFKGKLKKVVMGSFAKTYDR